MTSNCLYKNFASYLDKMWVLAVYLLQLVPATATLRAWRAVQLWANRKFLEDFVKRHLDWFSEDVVVIGDG